MARKPCEDEVVSQLLELLQRDGHIAAEEFFSAEKNARLVMNAERYYRSTFHGRDESWDLRDTHMFETLLDIRSPLDDGKAKGHRLGAQLASWRCPRDFNERERRVEHRPVGAGAVWS